MVPCIRLPYPVDSRYFSRIWKPLFPRGGGKFSTPGLAAVVSTLWRENVGASDLPPPPVFTLEDRNDFSPESGIPEYNMLGSPEVKSYTRTPIQVVGQDFSTPSKGKSEATTLYALSSAKQLQTQISSGSASWWSPMMTSDALNSGKHVQTQKNWWSPTITADEAEEKEQVSPVKGVAESGALLMLPLPREVARPEIQRNSLPAGNLDEEKWTTVDGDTNLVLREFEKYGIVLKHVPGPSNTNWMHILYQNRSDTRKALNKNGMQINGVLIVGVKPIDRAQRQAQDERLTNQGFLPLPRTTCRTVDVIPHRNSSDPSGNADSRGHPLPNPWLPR